MEIDDVLARPEDEFPHQLPAGSDARPWKDTWWFAFRDEAADVTGALHLTLSANRGPGCRITVAVRHGATQVVDWTSVEPDAGKSDFGCPWLGVDVVEPAWSSAKHLRLRLRHPQVSGNLELRGRFLGPLVGSVCPGLVPSADDGISLAGHVEQVSTFTGSLRIAGAEKTIAATGFRDRSWGFRKSEQMAPMGTILIAADLGDRAAALLSWMAPSAAPGQPVPVGGWLADDDRVVAATAGRYLRDSAGRPTALDVEFADGTLLRSNKIEATGELQYCFHEPEYDGPARG
ncbi:MAG: hypothetical protein LC792_28545, partial [Actinobacteria bacterium]|nr:hypothetical protein [Actinomycetota bacterium]